MKKVLALALALCMVFAMSAVAFAVDATVTQTEPNDDGNAQTVVVKTVFDEEAEPGAYDSYTVTIPADVTVEWGSEAASIDAVKVDYQLAATSSLQVASSYEDNAADQITSDMAAASSDLYTAGQASVETLAGTVAITAWGGAPAEGQLVGTVNYTVTYNNAYVGA